MTETKNVALDTIKQNPITSCIVIFIILILLSLIITSFILFIKTRRNINLKIYPLNSYLAKNAANENEHDMKKPSVVPNSKYSDQKRIEKIYNEVDASFLGQIKKSQDEIDSDEEIKQRSFSNSSQTQLEQKILAKCRERDKLMRKCANDIMDNNHNQSKLSINIEIANNLVNNYMDNIAMLPNQYSQELKNKLTQLYNLNKEIKELELKAIEEERDNIKLKEIIYDINLKKFEETVQQIIVYQNYESQELSRSESFTRINGSFDELNQLEKSNSLRNFSEEERNTRIDLNTYNQALQIV